MAPRADKSETTGTRGCIIDVASRLYRDDGYQRLTIREVAKAAGTTIGGVYFHFETKDALLGAVLSATLGRISTNVRAALSALPEGADPARRIRAAVEAHLEAVARHGEYPMLSRHLLGLIDREIAKAYRKQQRDYIALWHRLIGEGQAVGLVRSDISVTILVFFLFGAMTFTPEWYDAKRRPLPRVADEFCTYIFEGISVPTNKRRAASVKPAGSGRSRLKSADEGGARGASVRPRTVRRRAQKSPPT